MATATRTRTNGKHQGQAATLDQTMPASGTLAFRVMPLESFVRTTLFTRKFGRVSFEAAGNAIMERKDGELSHLMTLSAGLECRWVYVYLGADRDVSGWFVGTAEALDDLQAFQDRGKEITKAKDDIDEKTEQIHQDVQSFIYGGSAPYGIEAEV